MAFLDIDDKQDSNGDIVFTQSKHHKAYNLLSYNFVEMSEISLDIASYLRLGVEPIAIEQMIMQYLSDFKGDPHRYSVAFEQLNGRIQFTIDYTQ